LLKPHHLGLGVNRWFEIHVLLLFGLLVQVEAQFVLPFMTNGQIREDEVASFARTIKIGHARDRHTGEYWNCWWCWMSTTMCNIPDRFQGCEQEEVGVVSKGDISISILSLHDT
jgi:hypothetical protein